MRRVVLATQNTHPAFLSPTIFPLTHTTGVAERSTRRILSRAPVQAAHPAPGKAARKRAEKHAESGMSDAEKVEEELCARLVRATRAQWGDCERHTGSDIMRPNPVATEADRSGDNVNIENAGKPHKITPSTVLFELAVANHRRRPCWNLGAARSSRPQRWTLDGQKCC